MERVYLDHAATSWPKPPGVLEALVEFQSKIGAAGGRGVYASAQASNAIVSSVRSKLARLINAASPNDIGLTHNGTSALNLALSGLLRRGDHVLTTAAEHNSVLRPLKFLQRERGIELSIVPVDADGAVKASDIYAGLRRDTRLVAVTHASNVTGRIQPIEEIAAFVRNTPAKLLVDAAQTLGYFPIDVRQVGIDLLASPGHKGACGMLGTGLLYAAPETAAEITVPWPGGTGSDSENLDGPFGWPEGAEAGNLNLPALAAWNAGLDWLNSTSIEVRRDQALAMRSRLWSILESGSLGRLLGTDDRNCLPVVSVAIESMPCSDLAAILDSSFRIETRSGLHCAGLIHSHLGTRELGGTLRFSLGHTSTDRDLEQLEVAMNAIRISQT